MSLAARDIELLRDFLAAMEQAKTKCYLVGAGARVLTFDERWSLCGARATGDWDFAIRADSWEHWSELKLQLLRGSPPKFHAGRTEHRFFHTNGGALDLVPYGDLESPQGEIRWPPGDSRMSVHGLRETEVSREFLEMQPGLIVPVAATPSLALLKLDAYRDRRQRGERKDIQDFDWFLTNYESAGNALRVHDELGQVLRSGGLDIEDAGAALLGQDVARLHSMEAIAPVRELLVEARDPWSSLVADVMTGKMLIDDEDNQRRRDTVSRRFLAFEVGLDLPRPESGR